MTRKFQFNTSKVLGKQNSKQMHRPRGCTLVLFEALVPFWFAEVQVWFSRDWVVRSELLYSMYEIMLDGKWSCHFQQEEEISHSYQLVFHHC